LIQTTGPGLRPETITTGSLNGEPSGRSPISKYPRTFLPGAERAVPSPMPAGEAGVAGGALSAAATRQTAVSAATAGALQKARRVRGLRDDPGIEISR